MPQGEGTYGRRKGRPKKNAKTIPQKVARKELIMGGSAEAKAGIEKARKKRQLIAGKSMVEEKAPVSMKSAGVLRRNIRGGAVLREAEKVKVDKRTRGAKQSKQGVDIKKDSDLRRLAKVEKSRISETKISKLKVGDKVKFKYYGKEREGVVAKIPSKRGGFQKDIEIKSDAFKTADKIQRIRGDMIV